MNVAQSTGDIYSKIQNGITIAGLTWKGGINFRLFTESLYVDAIKGIYRNNADRLAAGLRQSTRITNKIKGIGNWGGKSFNILNAAVEGVQGLFSVVDGDYNQAGMHGLNAAVGYGLGSLGIIGIPLYGGYKLIMSPPAINNGGPAPILEPHIYECVPDNTYMVPPIPPGY